jgi:predicted acylesterase/phospholipase RssA
MQTLDLVFEGGGAKGIAFAGALDVLFEEGYRPGRVVGTSAGAIAAALVAAGYGPDGLLAAIREEVDGKPRFSTFFDTPPATHPGMAATPACVLAQLFSAIDLPLVPESVERRLDDAVLRRAMTNRRFRQLFGLVEHGGVYAGDTFLEWVREKLANKGIPPDATFKEFHRRARYDLSVIASDISGEEMLVLNHRTAPAMPVAWAVRASMSIPFVWREVVWEESWGQYLGRDKAGNAMVDGGMLSNFPVRLVASADTGVQRLMGTTSAAAGFLGLLIDEDQPVPGARAAGGESEGLGGVTGPSRPPPANSRRPCRPHPAPPAGSGCFRWSPWPRAFGCWSRNSAGRAYPS